MTLKREDIKKLVIQQMFQENLNNEGIADWLQKLGRAGKTTDIKADTKDTSQVDEKTLQKLGEFLQLAQPDPEISKLILQTPLGKKVFYSTSNKEQSLEESLYGDYVKMMKKAGVNQQMVTGFIEVMKTNKKALALLKQVGIDVSEKSDTQPAAGASKPPEGVSQQTQTGGQQAQTTPAAAQQQKPGAAQSEAGAEAAKRSLKPSQKGVKDTVGTEEYKKSIQGLSSVISNTLNIPTANAQKIIDDIWSQLGGKNGKFTKLTLLEQEFQLNLTKILQNNGVVGLRANNLINKIKEWAKQNSSFVTDSIGQQVPTTQQTVQQQTSNKANTIQTQPPDKVEAGTGDQAVAKAIKRVTAGNPDESSLKVIQTAANRTGELGRTKQKLKAKSQEILKKAQWSLSKDGQMSDKDKKYWIDQGGIVVAQEQLKEAIVEEIFNLLTGKTK
jgi:hypothetical protein